MALCSSNSAYSVVLESLLHSVIFHPLLSESCSSYVVGSCNGLFCFRLTVTLHPNDEGKFIIFNPSTRESKTLPDFRFVGLSSYVFYGFGYAESIDDYKFVKIIYSQERMAHIFSLKNNAWTIVQDDAPYPYSLLQYDDWGVPSLPICRDLGGTPFNGAIHWAFELANQNKYIVTAFELVQNKFKILPTPDNLLISRYKRYISVGVLGECLALMCMLREEESTTYRSEFWVMKVYGVKESWVRILTVHSETTVLTRRSFHYSPLCFWWKNNENNREMILFNGCKRLVIYDAKEVAYKDLVFIEVYGDDVDDCDYDTISYANFYVESLVSPNCNS